MFHIDTLKHMKYDCVTRRVFFFLVVTSLFVVNNNCAMHFRRLRVQPERGEAAKGDARADSRTGASIDLAKRDREHECAHDRWRIRCFRIGSRELPQPAAAAPFRLHVRAADGSECEPPSRDRPLVSDRASPEIGALVAAYWRLVRGHVRRPSDREVASDGRDASPTAAAATRSRETHQGPPRALFQRLFVRRERNPSSRICGIQRLHRRRPEVASLSSNFKIHPVAI